MNWLGYLLFLSILFLSFLFIPLLILLIYSIIYYIKIVISPMDRYQYIQDNIIDTQLISFSKNAILLANTQVLVFSTAFIRFIKLLFDLRIVVIFLIVVFCGMFLVNEFQEEVFTAIDKFYKDFFSIVIRPLVVSLLNITTFLYDVISPVINFIAALLNYPLRALLYIVRYCEPKFIINLLKTIASFIVAFLKSFFSWAEEWFFFAPFDLKTPTAALLSIIKDINAFNDCTCQSVGDLLSITTESLTKEYIPSVINSTFNSIWSIPRIPVTAFYNKKRPDLQPMTISLIETLNSTALFGNFILSKTVPKLINTLDNNLFTPEIMNRIENAFFPGIIFSPLESLLSVTNTSIHLVINIDIFAKGLVDAFHTHPDSNQIENILKSKRLLNLDTAFNLIGQYTLIINGAFDLFFKSTSFDFIKYPFVNLSGFLIDYFKYLWDLFITVLFNGFNDPLKNLRVNLWYTDQTDNLFSSLNVTMNSLIFIPSQFIEAFIPSSSGASSSGSEWINILRDVQAFVYLFSEILSSIGSVLINSFRFYIDFQINFDNFIKYIFCPYRQDDTDYCRGHPLQYDYIMNRNSSFNILLDNIESDLDALAVKTGSLLYFTNTKQCRGTFMTQCKKFHQEIECYLGDIIITTLELVVYILKYTVNVFKGIYSINIFKIIPDWKNSIRPRIVKIAYDASSVIFFFLTFGFQSSKCGNHCIALDFANMATDFFKFFLIVFDMIFSVLNAISSYVTGCEADNNNCNFNLSPLVTVILQDTFGVVIDILDSASDIYICLGGGTDNAFHLLSVVFKDVSAFLNTTLNGLFVEIIQFVFSILVGDFLTGLKALYIIIISIISDVLKIIYLIIEELVKVAFYAIFSPIIQNDFMCGICETFSIVARIVTWDIARIKCTNYCAPAPCFNDTINPNAPVCPKPHKTKTRFFDESNEARTEDSKLNINDMVTFMRQQEYIKKNQVTLERHSKFLNEHAKKQILKRSIEVKDESSDKTESNTGILDQMKDSTTMGTLFRILVDNTIQPDNEFPKITRESCLYTLYSLQNKTLPSIFTKMNKIQRIEFKKLAKACTIVESVFDLSTMADPKEPDGYFFSKIQPKSACDEWIRLLNKTKDDDNFYSENFNKKMIEIHATSCIKERILVSFVNKFILQLGEQFRPLILSKDFFSDPLIASTDMMKIMFQLFNASGVFSKEEDDYKFKSFIYRFTHEEKTEKLDFGLTKKERTNVKKSGPSLVNTFQSFIFGSKPTKIDFCSIEFNTNAYFFSFLSVYCKGQYIIESPSVNIELSKYCPYGEMAHNIVPEVIIEKICNKGKNTYKEELIHGVVHVSNSLKETLSRRRVIQTKFLSTYNERYLLDNPAPVYWHLREFKDKKQPFDPDNTDRSHRFLGNSHWEFLENNKKLLKIHREKMKAGFDNQYKKIKTSGFLSKRNEKLIGIEEKPPVIVVSKEKHLDELFLKESSKIFENSKALLKMSNIVIRRVLLEDHLDRNNPLRGSLYSISKRITAAKKSSAQQGFFDCAILDNFVDYLQIESQIVDYYYGNCYPLYEEYFKNTFNFSETPIKPVCIWPEGTFDSPNPYMIKIDLSFLDNLTGKRKSPTRNKTIELINNNTFSRTTKTALNSFFNKTSDLINTIVNNLPSEKNQTLLFSRNDKKRDFFWYLKHFLTCNNRGGNFCSIGGLGLKKGLIVTLILSIVYLIIKKYFIPAEINILPLAIVTILIITWMAAYLYSPMCIPQIPTCFMVDVQEIILDLVPPYLNWGPFLASSLSKNLSKIEGVLKRDFYLNRECTLLNTTSPKCFNGNSSDAFYTSLSQYDVKMCYSIKYATLDYLNSSQCQIPKILLDKKESDNRNFIENKDKSFQIDTSNSTIFLICHQEFELIDPFDSLLMASHVYIGKEYPLRFLDINIPIFYQIVHSSVIKDKIDRYKNPVYDNKASTTACFYLTSYLLIPILIAVSLLILLLIYFGPSTISFFISLAPLLFDLYMIITSMCFEILFRDEFK